MTERVKLTEAWAEAEEVRSWTCRSCNDPSEDHSPYCRSCRTYWEDVSKGLFDDGDTNHD